MACTFGLHVTEVEDTTVSISITLGRELIQVTIGTMKNGKFPIYRWDSCTLYKILRYEPTFIDAAQAVWTEALKIAREGQLSRVF